MPDDPDIFAAFGVPEEDLGASQKLRKFSPSVPGREDPAPFSLQQKAKDLTEEALNTLAQIMRHAENDSTRLEAARQILDRGWGKPSINVKQETIKYTLQDVENKLLEHREYVDAKVIEARRIESEQLGRYIIDDVEVVEDSALRRGSTL